MRKNRRFLLISTCFLMRMIITLPISYRNYEQIKMVIKNYFERHTEYSKNTLSQYLNDHCIDWPDIKKIKMEVGCTCRV